ncbi:MAG: hypothetical protein AAF727_11750 [Pseudomonadota bacterium]
MKRIEAAQHSDTRAPLCATAFVLLCAVLAPSMARADACETHRPDWDGVAFTATGEALSLFATPLSLVALALTLIAVRLRHPWLGLMTVLAWTGIAMLVTMLDPTGTRAQAMAEGCVGPATLFILAVAAICVGTVIYTMPRKADG